MWNLGSLRASEPSWLGSTQGRCCGCRCARCGRCGQSGRIASCQMPSDELFGIVVLARFKLKRLVHLVDILHGKMLVQPLLDAKACLATSLFRLWCGNLICMDGMWVFTSLPLGTIGCVWIEEAGVKIKISWSWSCPWSYGTTIGSCPTRCLHGWRRSWLNHWILQSHSLHLLVSRLPWLSRSFVGVGRVPKTLIHM